MIISFCTSEIKYNWSFIHCTVGMWIWTGISAWFKVYMLFLLLFVFLSVWHFESLKVWKKVCYLLFKWRNWTLDITSYTFTWHILFTLTPYIRYHYHLNGEVITAVISLVPPTHQLKTTFLWVIVPSFHSCLFNWSSKITVNLHLMMILY